MTTIWCRIQESVTSCCFGSKRVSNLTWYALNKHSSHEKFLGQTIDNELSFDEHIISICKTAKKKLNALRRMNYYMKQNQKEILLLSFIISHFSYCPLIWIFCSKKSTKKVNAVSLPLIIRRNTPNNISPTMYKFSYDRSL